MFGASAAMAAEVAFGQATNKSLEDEKPTPSKDLPHIGLIAVLSDEAYLQNSTRYPGLTPVYPEALKEQTLPERITRYAHDAQLTQEFTRSIIIPVKKNQSVKEISDMLERLYLEGDGKSGEINHLAGIVIVGDVPLPVVNKNGYHFVSLFPYTDFTDKSYVFDETTQDFIPNKNVTTGKVEIWHGIIKPPVSGEEGNNLLASYFDKNHLFHCQESSCADAAKDFQEFGKKILSADMVSEWDLMNKPGYANYLRYLANREDLAYNRYNKYWLMKLQQESEGLLKTGDGIDNDADGKIDEDPIDGIDNDLDGEPGSPLHGLSDGIDNDGDGKVDEEDEGRFGLCDGSKKLKDCSIPGVQLLKDHFYNVKAGSKYFVADGIDNDHNGAIDENIDEDNGDFYKGIDNDLDGQIDEDTTTDNDADHDKKIDEDPSGDINKDGCPGDCGVDEDLDSYDFDSDGYSNGYEKQFGMKTQVGDVPTDPNLALSIPMDFTGGPPVLRLIPPPLINDPWIDEEPAADDDEDGKIDEDGLADNDKDKDGLSDEDPDGSNLSGVDASSMTNFPDIATKPLIENFLSSYFSLFDKFKANINDWTRFTGRYDPAYTVTENGKNRQKSDVSTLPGLITAKDEFTDNYLRRVNDAVEAKIDSFIEDRSEPNFTAPQLQAPVPMIQSSKIQLTAKVTDANGDEQMLAGPVVEFINFSQNEFVGVPFLYINGQPVVTLQNVQSCSLIRGSEGVPGSNSIAVEANHTYNVFDSSISPLYAGCSVDNYSKPERCFIDRATLPVFDILGTKEVTNVPESEKNFSACFDFKEKTAYENYRTAVDLYLNLLSSLKLEELKKVLPLPKPPYVSADDILLADLSQIDPNYEKIHLGDLLKTWGSFDTIDNDNDGLIDEADESSFSIPSDDHKQIGERILKGRIIAGQPLPTIYTLNLNNQPSYIKELTFVVEPSSAIFDSNAVRLSSFVTHKEPTAETLAAQSKPGKSPQSLPIDKPRFFSFLDKNNVSHTIKYPNLFAAKSWDEVRLLLALKEQELEKIAQDNNVTLPIKNSLTDIIDGKTDLFADSQQSKILKANVESMKDAYAWKNMNIDQKHRYVLHTYLNPSENAFVGETPKGYETMYLVSDGDANNLMMGFNAAVPEKDEDPEFQKALHQPLLPRTLKATTDAKEFANGEDPGNSNASDSVGSGSNSSSEQVGSSQQALEEKVEPVEITQWFSEMEKWVGDLQKTGDTSSSEQACSIADSPGDYYEQLLAQGDSDGDGVPDSLDKYPQSVDGDKDGIPDGAEETAQLSLHADTNVLRAGKADTLTIEVEGQTSQKELAHSDNFTKVTLLIQQPVSGKIAEIVSANPVSLVNGKAHFTIASTDVTGNFQVRVNSPNNKVYASNTLSLSATKQAIRLTSYRKIAKEDFIQQKATGYVIKNTKGKIIAEVDSTTGMVTLLDNRFELGVLPSAQGKPVRIIVKEKQSGKIFASVFFILPPAVRAGR